jgi:hypothetical protein
MVGRLAGLAAAGALTFVGLPVASASAGTNGQHVEFCLPGGPYYAMLEGTNERGDLVYEGLDTTMTPDRDASCSTSELWWKDEVQLSVLIDDGWVRLYRCIVPESMDGDVFQC